MYKDRCHTVLEPVSDMVRKVEPKLNSCRPTFYYAPDSEFNAQQQRRLSRKEGTGWVEMELNIFVAGFG